MSRTTKLTTPAPVLWLLIGSMVSAETKVDFDVSASAPMHVVVADADRQLIQVSIRISPRMNQAVVQQVGLIEYLLVVPYASVTITDFLPNTELEDIGQGLMIVSERRQSNLGAEAAAGIGFAGKFLPSAQASVAGRRTHETDVSAQLILPKRLLVSTGTRLREHGIFVKHRPSPRDTLERQHVITLLLDAPVGFCGGCLYLHASARTTTGNKCGSFATVLGIYPKDDAVKKSIAENLATALHACRASSALTQDEVYWDKAWTVSKRAEPILASTYLAGLQDGLLKQDGYRGIVGKSIAEDVDTASLLRFAYLGASWNEMLLGTESGLLSSHLRATVFDFQVLEGAINKVHDSKGKSDEERMRRAVATFAETIMPRTKAHFAIADHLELLEMPSDQLKAINWRDKFSNGSMARALAYLKQMLNQ